MWRIIARREIVAGLTSSRTPMLAVLLILLFVAIGRVSVMNYAQQTRDYASRVQAHRDELRKYRSLIYLDSAGYYLDRAPQALSVVVRGADGSFGNIVKISQWVYPGFSGGASDSPLVSAFTPVDFLFVLRVLVSLCAILVTFDAIAGERESGTLRLILIGRASRRDVYVGKLIGALTNLAVPATLAFLAGLVAIASALSAPWTIGQWMRLLALWLNALLYMTIFVALGLLLSTIARSSRESLVYGLVIWTALVILIPRGLLAGAGLMAREPDLSRNDAEIEILKQNARQEAIRRLAYLVESTRRQLSVPTIFLVNHTEATVVAPKAHALRADYETRRRAYDRTAEWLTALAPASAFSHVAMQLAGTSLRDFDRYLDDVKRYRADTLAYYDQFKERGIPFNVDTLPAFHPSTRSLAHALRESALSLVSLGLWLLGFTGAGVTMFGRYDPR